MVDVVGEFSFDIVEFALDFFEVVAVGVYYFEFCGVAVVVDEFYCLFVDGYDYFDLV